MSPSHPQALWRLSALATATVAALMAGCAQLPTAGGAGAAAAAPTAASAASAAPQARSASAPVRSAVATAAAASGPARAASGPTAATPPAPPAPGQPPPFAVVIKDAKEIKGLFSAWQKDERLWIELRPEDFDKPFFLSPKLSSGIGESMLFGGLMLPSPRLVQWKRVHNVVRLEAINTQQIAKAGTPEARAVASAISPSLLGSIPVASAAHPERKSVLIDGGAIFVGDMLGLGQVLQRTYRQGYSLDGRNSAITGVRGKPDLLVLEVQNHYATPVIAIPTPGAPPGAPVPTVPSGLADPRSLFLGIHYSLARLPEQPMAARAADARVGYFLSTTDDFTDDLARSPRKRVVNRWRLEKKDPAAELSEPVKPITYWLDRNIPLKYREVITAGILEWNKAFEKIGFKNAIEVKQQPDDADWDTLDAGIASVRWMVNREPVFGAIGPSHVDPRSGEILDADIGMESLSSRNIRAARARILGAASGPAEWAQLMQVAPPPADDAAARAQLMACTHGDEAAEQLGFALDVMAARGELDPDSPEAQAFVMAYLKDTTMHEVGHTLGLRHNFRASRIFSDRQVGDPAFTKDHAFTGSVMEYSAINLPRPGEPAAAPFQVTLGPYDDWAIAYAYKPVPAADERAELQRIAGRNGERELAYGTDEDNFLGIDPDALQFDLGDDPIAFAARRFDIVADLLKRQETRTLRPDEDYAALRRSVAYALRDAGRAAGVVLRQIGGVRTLRDFPNTQRDPLQPVPAEVQRAALSLLSQRVLAPGAFAVSPALQRRLAPDFLERLESLASTPTEFPLGQNVLDLQRALLNRLMSDDLARRVLDSEAKFDSPAQAFHLRELYQRLEADVWSELASHAEIGAARRDLQREHLNRLTALVIRPGQLGRADARALVRSQAAALLARIDRASRQASLSDETRAHLKDCADSLRSTLAAKMERTGA